MVIESLQKGEMTVQDIWNAYQDLVAYNGEIQLAETVEENRFMYIGRQWEGIETEGLPTAVLDFIKPVVQFKVSSITSARTKVTVHPVGLSGTVEKEKKKIANIINQKLDQILEREQLEKLLMILETNTAIDGDGAWHIYWDERIKTGEDLSGDIAIENIPNLNVYFGNTCSNLVEDQPYIIVERREYITNLKAYARELGISEMEIDNIRSDTDNQYSILHDDNRVTVLTFYYRDYETETIKMIECTDNLILQEEDTGLELYPVCWQNWEPRLNDYHGEPLVSELVTNQITVNKLASMNAISLSRTAFPTILYNASLLPEGWDNSVGAAIGITDLPDLNARDVASVVEGTGSNYQVQGFYNELIALTKDLNGASDAVLGNIDPTNTSAIIALQKTAMVPLELNKRRLYTFLEDFARIAIDFMANYYGERVVLIEDPETGEKKSEKFDFTKLKDAAFNVKIDIGASSYWSELTELQTLEKLVNMGVISGEEYLEYMPDGLFANRNDILNKLKKAKKEAEEKQAALPAGGMKPAAGGNPAALAGGAAAGGGGVANALMSMLQKSPDTAGRLKDLSIKNPMAYEQVIKNLNQKI